MKHKKQPMHDPSLWRSLLDQCVSRAPSVRQAPVDGSAYKCPYGVLMSWIKGEASPPVTKIIAAANLLGCTEHQVAMAVHGFNSQADAVAARKAEQALKQNKASREKYATSPELRLKNKMYTEKSKEKRRAKILAGPMFTQSWATTASHMRREGIITKSELLFIKETGLQRYVSSGKKQHTREKNREKEREAARIKKEKRMEEMLNDPDYWLKKASRSLDILLARTEKLRKEIDAYGQRLNRPWHKAGYMTKEKWAAETPEGRRYQLEHWQVVTHRRRAKKMQAGGRGVTRDEWFAIMKKWDYHCAYCGARRYSLLPNGSKVKMTMDHVIAMPLGKDEPCNILPACLSCNTSKAGNDLMVWAATKGVNVHPLAVEQYNRLLDKYTEPTHATR